MLQKTEISGDWMTDAYGVTTVSLLHSFDLRRDRKSLPLPPASQRLVAFLALQSAAVRRVYVAGVLWIDFAQGNANADLRTALWRLTRLPCRLVDASPTHLSLSSAVDVDVREAMAVAHRINTDGCDRAETDLERMVGAGELLPDWYDDWMVIERERFRQARLHALESLCVALSGQGRHQQAIEAGLAAVAGEPLRESAHRVVIHAHLAEGNRGEALRQYALYHRVIVDQLGVGPSVEMERLRHWCVSVDGTVMGVA
jgi:DNA-binding SARP family transcriptional activator